MSCGIEIALNVDRNGMVTKSLLSKNKRYTKVIEVISNNPTKLIESNKVCRACANMEVI